MDDDYLEAVLGVVELIPSGRVMTYGTVAEVVAEVLVATGGHARGGPRQVGRVMALAGGGVAWWRVVNAAGRSTDRLAARALDHWLVEGTPLTADSERIVLRRAIWFPHEDAALSAPSAR